MKSKWSHLKSKAIRLRKTGKSLPYVHQTLGIPKSTLSYWFKDIKLTQAQEKRLHKNWEQALVKARQEAVKWHNEQKAKRLILAEIEATETMKNVNLSDNHNLEVALALLYLGEGTKAKEETGMGSSDPRILKFFISCLVRIYDIPINKIRCELHLRADQKSEQMITYWSKELGVPKNNFIKPYHDKRTIGTKTYPDYKGVCLVRCGTVAIQRKLVYIAKQFCDEIIDSHYK